MIWLTVSLFALKKNWHIVIRDGIGSFLDNNPLIKYYYLEFNYSGGDNLRLALLTCKNDAFEIASLAKKHFDSYFTKSSLTPQCKGKNGIFMSFPSNSIHFGLFRPSIGNGKKSESALSAKISESMTGAFKDEIDDEAIITFALYLNLALLKAFFKYRSSLKLGDPGVLTSLDNNFNDNTDQVKINELMIDIMNRDAFEPDMNWLNNWFEHCCKTFEKLPIDLDAKKTYEKFVDSFCRQLCVSGYGKISLSIWMKNGLNYFVSTLTK